MCRPPTAVLSPCDILKGEGRGFFFLLVYLLFYLEYHSFYNKGHLVMLTDSSEA